MIAGNKIVSGLNSNIFLITIINYIHINKYTTLIYSSAPSGRKLYENRRNVMEVIRSYLRLLIFPSITSLLAPTTSSIWNSMIKRAKKKEYISYTCLIIKGKKITFNKKINILLQKS